jgi:hypothetical protein
MTNTYQAHYYKTPNDKEDDETDNCQCGTSLGCHLHSIEMNQLDPEIFEDFWRNFGQSISKDLRRSNTPLPWDHELPPTTNHSITPPTKNQEKPPK